VKFEKKVVFLGEKRMVTRKFEQRFIDSRTDISDNFQHIVFIKRIIALALISKKILL
jgi:hypothetical protein